MFMTILLYCCFTAYRASDIKAEENISLLFWVSLITFSTILFILSASLINFIATENIDSVNKSRYASIVYRNSDLLISVALLLAPYVAFSNKKIPKYFILILFVLMSLTFLAIQPLKASLLLAFIAIIYILLNVKLSQINKYIILGGSIGILFLGLIYGPVNKIAEACKTKYTKEVVDQRKRLQLWKNSIDLAKESPLFGHGKNNWELAIGKYGHAPYELSKPIISPKEYRHSFSIASQLLSELGIIGIIAFLYIFILPCFRLINERAVLSMLEVAALVSFVTFLILGLIYGAPLNYFKSFQGPVFISFIGLAIISEKSNLSTILFTTQSKFTNLIILVGAISSITYFSSIRRGDMHHIKAQKAFLEKNYELSSQEAAYSLDILPESKNSQVLYHTLIKQNKKEEATLVLEEALKIDPYNIELLYIYADNQFKSKDIESAVSISTKIQKIAPHYLYNNGLMAKCAFLQNPTNQNYQNLLKVSKQLFDFKTPKKQNTYLKYKTESAQFNKFMMRNKSKISSAQN